MKEFKMVNKTFIKSNNTTNKIFNRYLYSLIPFILLIIIYNLIWGSNIVIINLIKSNLISLFTCITTEYIFNLINKKKNNLTFIFEENILTISIILGLFAINSKIFIIIISGVVSILMKNILKNTKISSSLYGILIIIIYSYFTKDLNTPLSNLKELSYIDTYSNVLKSYGTITSYIFGLKYYLSPILSILSFIYLLFKKSIKYNIVFSYILTFIVIMLIFGIINNMNIWYLFFQLTTGNILFLTIFCLPDYPNTPTTKEGQIIYGIILAIITSILRFIVPELSVIISIIIGQLLLTKIINRISIKLKYNKKYYYLLLLSSLICISITIILINIII